MSHSDPKQLKTDSKSFSAPRKLLRTYFIWPKNVPILLQYLFFYLNHIQYTVISLFVQTSFCISNPSSDPLFKAAANFSRTLNMQDWVTTKNGLHGATVGVYFYISMILSMFIYVRIS